jgi:hypothetical protein
MSQQATVPTEVAPLPSNVIVEDGKIIFVGSNQDWCEEHGEDYLHRDNVPCEDVGEG